MRIALAGFMHESNTFAITPTTVQNFKDAALHTGVDLIPHWKDAHHEMGGFIEGAQTHGCELVPVLMAWATPSGPLTADTYEHIVGDLLSGLKKTAPFDGLLLALHGAMVSEQYLNADGETMARVRALLGPDMPIVLTLDLHANISPRMVENATATITYKTYPHVKQRDRGREAASLIARTVRGEIHPVQALRKPPLLHHIVRQYTESGITAEVMAQVAKTEAIPGVLSASYAPGFPYADVPDIGPAVIVVANKDIDLAEREAQHLNDFIWDRRESLTARLPSPAEAVAQALAHPGQPITLLDVGDNVGGGSPGDSTILLSEMLRQNARDGLVILYDPQAVAQCVQTGVRNPIMLDVGGKTDDRHGKPVSISGTVKLIADGRYIETEPRHGGKRFGDMGRTAVVQTEEGHLIILHSLREAPMSLQQILSLGIKPETRKIMVAKGAVAPRAAYEPVSAATIPVDTPGVTAAGPEHFTYKNRPKPLYPLD